MLRFISEELLHSFVSKLLVSVVLVLLGFLIGKLFERWRHAKLRRSINAGSEIGTCVVEQIVINTNKSGAATMRIRSCGAGPIEAVFHNPVARSSFLKRAEATTIENPLISMEGKDGSYFLNELTHWVSGFVAQKPFPHDLWVMAPVSEPPLFSSHRNSTVLLVREKDLSMLKDWSWCEKLLVEHGSDGGRLISLHLMALEYERQKEEIAARRANGGRADFVETMWVLELGLCVNDSVVAVKPVEWSRFSKVLSRLKLETSLEQKAA